MYNIKCMFSNGKIVSQILKVKNLFLGILSWRSPYLIERVIKYEVISIYWN